MRPCSPFGMMLVTVLTGACGGKIASSDVPAAPECTPQSGGGAGDGGGSTLLATIPVMDGIVVDACNVYVAANDPGPPFRGDIYRVALDGGGATPLGTTM